MMDTENPLQHYLSDTMEMNRQLSVCVQRKQEEISALQQKNTQLMELLEQAEFHATLLDIFTPPPDPPSASAFTPHSDSYSSSTESCDQRSSTAPQSSWLESLLNHTPLEEEDWWSHSILSEHTDTGVKRKLWAGDVESSSEDKKSRLGREFLYQSEHRSSEQSGSETVQAFGSFRNYLVLKATPCLTSDLSREGKCAFFKTSIREHSTVRTGVFPHGKTFTSHTADGGCRFLWIPKQN